MLSIVIPIFNERENIDPLCDKLRQELPALGQEFEVILVNDGSNDGTERALEDAARKNPRFKVINLRRNFGQTAAMMAGIDFARGDVIIPMDGDLQNDPADIRRLLDKLAEGYDVVSGWRKDRQDSNLTRNIPSRIANRLISWISGIHLRDYGCSLKAYRRDVIKGVRLYGEMHRFIPIYASWYGARVTEIPVTHHPRTRGNSKYGLDRILKVILDLLVIKFLAGQATKPIYIFGGFGLATILSSLVVGGVAVYLRLFEQIAFILTPLPLLAVMLFVMGILSILLGLVAELVVRTYYESQGKPVYLIKNTINTEARS